MPRLARGLSAKAGLPPGSVVATGKKKADKTGITVIDYDEGSVQEKQVDSVEQCFPFRDKPSTTWINVDGLHDTKVIESLGTRFNLHPLTLEDIAHTGRRPKMDDVENYMFITINMLSYEDVAKEIKSEQVSIVLTENCVISFQEKEGDVFEPIRDRIRTGKGRVRKMGADYLAYALLDTVVDHYFVILEKSGERLEAIEESILDVLSPESLHTIHQLKGETISLRRSIWPLREVAASLARAESPLIKESTVAYLRDLYDHTVQVVETVETFRDLVAGLRDTYLSSVSNRMNEVMKVLTIIATIFIPITFVAGVYGMNFQYMPELAWRGGYFSALGLMAAIALGMIVYFRKKQWL